jgi:hypothetical protein
MHRAWGCIGQQFLCLLTFSFIHFLIVLILPYSLHQTILTTSIILITGLHPVFLGAELICVVNDSVNVDLIDLGLVLA